MLIKEASEVVKCLLEGRIVVMPTDTLFALSCDATNRDAIDRLYGIKKRDREKKLPVFFHSSDHVREYCYMPEVAERLAKSFWPGKLTIILRNKNLDSFTEDVAVRVPGSSEILSIIRELNRPIIGTSANISGCNNLYEIKDVEEQFRDSEVSIFRGSTTISKVQSTIVTIEENNEVKIIREGAISQEEIDEVLKLKGI